MVPVSTTSSPDATNQTGSVRTSPSDCSDAQPSPGSIPKDRELPGSDTDREGEPGAMIQLDRVGLRFRNVTNGSPSLKQAVVNALHGRRYEPDAEPFWLYRDLSLRIGHGERIGIIGPNGAGKSTLLKMICGIYRPTRGLIRVRGRIAPLLEMGAGFAAELSGVENVVLTGAIQGFSRRRVLERIDRIMDFAGLDRFRDTPIKYYSSGMMSRLAFATATDLDPEILLVDEVLSAGDAEFIERARSRISELVDASHIMVLVSHSMGAITSMCTRVIWIDSGRVIADGPPGVVVERFTLHYALPPDERPADLSRATAELGALGPSGSA